MQVQIVTGILLAMHYTPHVVCAGVSIEHILREVYGGWMLRHAGCLAPAGQYGSNHPLVGANPVDKSAFLTDTIIKDLVGLLNQHKEHADLNHQKCYKF